MVVSPSAMRMAAEEWRLVDELELPSSAKMMGDLNRWTMVWRTWEFNGMGGWGIGLGMLDCL